MKTRLVLPPPRRRLPWHKTHLPENRLMYFSLPLLLSCLQAKKKAEEAEAARAAELKASREKEAARQSELAAAARERKAARARQKAEAEAAAEASERKAKTLEDVVSTPVAPTAGSGSTPASLKEATLSTVSSKVRHALWARLGSHVSGFLCHENETVLIRQRLIADSCVAFVLAFLSAVRLIFRIFPPKLRVRVSNGRIRLPHSSFVHGCFRACLSFLRPCLFVRLKLPTLTTRRPQEGPPAPCPRSQ